MFSVDYLPLTYLYVFIFVTKVVSSPSGPSPIGRKIGVKIWDTADVWDEASVVP